MRECIYRWYAILHMRIGGNVSMNLYSCSLLDTDAEILKWWRYGYWYLGYTVWYLSWLITNYQRFVNTRLQHVPWTILGYGEEAGRVWWCWKWRISHTRYSLLFQTSQGEWLEHRKDWFDIHKVFRVTDEYSVQISPRAVRLGSQRSPTGQIPASE